MKFKFPEVIDIESEVDGRAVSGSYSVMLGDLIVYYYGHTSSTRTPATGIREAAIEMLQQLARKHYVDIEAIPRDLPQHVREAAASYANDPENEELIRGLVESLGPAVPGLDAHLRVSWLCLNALELVVPFWKAMCDDDAPQHMLGELLRWMNDRSHPVDWESARRPLVGYRDGRRIEDCDACRTEPIAKALARCADYLQTASVDSAVKTISEAWAAHTEGCWPEDEQRPFELWLVQVGLSYAYRFSSVVGQHGSEPG